MKNRIEILGRLKIAGIDQIKRVYSVTGIAPTISTMQGGQRQPKIVVVESSKKMNKDDNAKCECIVVAMRGRGG